MGGLSLLRGAGSAKLVEAELKPVIGVCMHLVVLIAN